MFSFEGVAVVAENQLNAEGRRDLPRDAFVSVPIAQTSIGMEPFVHERRYT